MMNAGFLPKDDDNGWIVLSVDSIGDVAPVVTMSNNSAILDSTKTAGIHERYHRFYTFYE